MEDLRLRSLPRHQGQGTCGGRTPALAPGCLHYVYPIQERQWKSSESFDCTKTLNGHTLKKVTVQMEAPETCYSLVALSKEDTTTVACIFRYMMKFTVKDCDLTTGKTDDEGSEDEYVLEGLEATIADHIKNVMKLNFEAT
ncbi:hypothetical protein QTO34_002399 [Cnephaeus nilssonii]|uniref:Coatomer gamma subunit appendage Ig-like subdomain domain-containing protein n=1 Tax=Cnephaeus nilssonii TaxID=3371016 RepID=A0AA40HUW1_CNENI|nr:hypothetical protein QTO34_002399 [Eptesicus nilssonii]